MTRRGGFWVPVKKNGPPASPAANVDRTRTWTRAGGQSPAPGLFFGLEAKKVDQTQVSRYGCSRFNSGGK